MIFERGVQIRSTSKKGGPDGGPILGPMLKSLHRGTKGGVMDPPPPPGSATGLYIVVWKKIERRRTKSAHARRTFMNEIGLLYRPM